MKQLAKKNLQIEHYLPKFFPHIFLLHSIYAAPFNSCWPILTSNSFRVFSTFDQKLEDSHCMVFTPLVQGHLNIFY